MPTPQPLPGTTCLYPNCTREQKTRGYCGAHYQKVIRDGTLPRIRHPKGTNKCKAIEPCTRPISSKNLCTMHYNRQRLHGTTAPLPQKIARKFNTGTPCLGCKHPLRPKGTKRVNHPGTLAHQAGGYCAPCYKAIANGNPTSNHRENTPTPLDTLTGNDLINRHNLDAYLGRRRTQGIPPEGLNILTWTHKNRVDA